MGLFDRWLPTKRETGAGLSAHEKALLNEHGTFATWFTDCLPASSQRLSENPEVLTAIERIAEIIGIMTIQQWENTDNGDVRVKDGLSHKIDINPYRNMTRTSWVKWIVTELLLYGNAIIYPHTSLNPDSDVPFIDDLEPIPHGIIRYQETEDGYEIVFNDTGRVMRSDEVLHFVLNPMPDKPWKGQGYKVSLADIVNNLKQESDTKKDFMASKIMPSIIVKIDALSEEMNSEEGRKAVVSRYLDTQRRGEPWVIPAELLDVQQVKPMSLSDIALNESVELDRKGVASILGIPAYMLGVGAFNKDEYNNFIKTRIHAIVKVIEQTLTMGLLVSPKRYFKMNKRNVLDYDIQTLSAVYSALAAQGIVNGNEVRDVLGLSPMQGLDELVLLENYIKLSDIQKQKKLQQEGDSDEQTE